ncbi:DUF5710 domain-containing protein [Rhodospirillum sp. A1_3_36]|uniref:DUF5710 domain-containing protein n=1 Tax=Rhodospirillum sp. A1_3_36 TaxID=3391666 RepID=UPI0039A6BB46
MADQSYRSQVAEDMIRQIKAGTTPWQKPWTPGLLRTGPHNPSTDKSYRGMNAWWLEMQGRADPRWLTYRQAAALDAQVRKGEQGTTVEYWQWSEEKPLLDARGKKILGEDGKPKMVSTELDRPRVFHARVFNAEQIDGLAPLKVPEPTFEPVAEAERILAAGGVPIHHDQSDRAYYHPSMDAIHLPLQEAFPTAYAYYATALHELGHATGHPKRLDRTFGPFGSRDYAVEELRAEMASFMVATELGLGHYPERHANYVEGWLKAVSNDHNVLFRAARDAEQIRTWVMEPDRRLALEKGADMDKSPKPTLSTEAIPTDMKAPEKEPGQRIYLAVPFDEREQAKKIGAKWDRAEKSWYVPEGTKATAFAQWEKKDRIQASSLAPAETESQRVPNAETYQEKVKAALKDTPYSLFSQYLTDATSAYLGTEMQSWADLPRIWSDAKIAEAHIDAILDRATIAGNWPIKAAEVMGLEGGRNDLSQLARDLPFLDWDSDFSDDRHARQRAREKIQSTEKSFTSLVAMGPKHAELASVLWDKVASVNSRAPDARPVGYVAPEARNHPFVAKLADDPFAAVLEANGLGQAVTPSMEQQPGKAPQPRIYLAVPFDERTQAKKMGAKWDRAEKSWYVPEGTEATAFAQWEKKNITQATAPAPLKAEDKAPEQVPAKAPRTYLAVPFEEKEAVKKRGAKWDRTRKSWYAPEGADLAPFERWRLKEAAPTPPRGIDPTDEFAQALKKEGLVLKGKPDMDGKWHRVPVIGDKQGSLSGSYRGFLDGKPNGSIMNYKNGQEAVKWISTGTSLDPKELERLKVEANARQAAREDERKALSAGAEKQAQSLWNDRDHGPIRQDHPYLLRKDITASPTIGSSRGNLLVPMYDTEGTLRNIQAIDPNGEKRYIKGGRKAGLMHVIGGGEDPTKGDFFILAEGYATNKSLHDALGLPVVVAFDAHNLQPVAEALRKKNPTATLIIAGDDDHSRDRNVGFENARVAAATVGGVHISPRFTEAEEAQGLTDYNDLAGARGEKAFARDVRKQVDTALGVKSQDKTRTVAGMAM